MSKWLGLMIPVLVVTAGILYFLVFTSVVKVDSSRPPGATVQIDGVVVGTTPLKHRVRTGVRQITLYKAGFEMWHKQVKVSPGPASAISVGLRFLLRSDPAGAEVIVDGENVGETDLAIDLETGMHEFEFRKDGYQTAKFKAAIPPDVSTSIPVVTLRPVEPPPPEKLWTSEEPPSPEFGNIQVTSTPDAQVYLDGDWQGETPLTMKKVLAGSYVITLSKEGYRELRRTVYVKKDETAKFAGELKPEPVEEVR